MKTLSRILFCLFLLAGLAGAASALRAEEAPAAQPLSDEQIDQIFDQIFAMQQKITRMQATVITSKKGSVFGGETKTLGYAFARMPDCLLFIDRGDVKQNLPEDKATTILIDGTYLWDIKPGDSGAMEAERLTVKNAGDRDINIAALLIGADVSTGKQLREYYLLTGTLEDYGAQGKSYHFLLKTIPGKEKKKVKEEVEVWIRPGEVIPWKIRSARMTPKVNPLPGADESGAPVSYKTTESTKEISELQTNLSTPPLPPFAPERFYFGALLTKFPAMRILDSRGQEIDKGQLQQELQSIYSRLQQPAPTK